MAISVYLAANIYFRRYINLSFQVDNINYSDKISTRFGYKKILELMSRLEQMAARTKLTQIPLSLLPSTIETENDLLKPRLVVEESVDNWVGMNTVGGGGIAGTEKHVGILSSDKWAINETLEVSSLESGTYPGVYLSNYRASNINTVGDADMSVTTSKQLNTGVLKSDNNDSASWHMSTPVYKFDDWANNNMVDVGVTGIQIQVDYLKSAYGERERMSTPVHIFDNWANENTVDVITSDNSTKANANTLFGFTSDNSIKSFDAVGNVNTIINSNNVNANNTSFDRSNLDEASSILDKTLDIPIPTSQTSTSLRMVDVDVIELMETGSKMNKVKPKFVTASKKLIFVSRFFRGTENKVATHITHDTGVTGLGIGLQMDPVNTQDSIKRNSIISKFLKLVMTAHTADDASNDDLNDDESNVEFATFGGLFETNEFKDETFRAEVRVRRLLSSGLHSVFLFHSPKVFFRSMEILMLFQSLYVSIVFTQFIPIVVHAGHNWGWIVCFLLPIFFTFAIIQGTLSKAVILRSVYKLDCNVAGKVLDDFQEGKKAICKLVEEVKNKFLMSKIPSSNWKSTLKQIFFRFDKKNTGLVSKKHFYKVLIIDFGIIISTERFEIFWKEIDYDLSNNLDWGEILKIFYPNNNVNDQFISVRITQEPPGIIHLRTVLKNKLSKQNMPLSSYERFIRQLFEQYDVDETNKIDTEEFTELLRESGYDIQPAELKMIFRNIANINRKKNKDDIDLLDFEEFFDLLFPYTQVNE